MPNQPSLKDMLRRAQCFASLGEPALSLLEQRMRMAAYEPGDTICEEGEPGDWMFIVASGEIAVLKTAEDGAHIQVATLCSGDLGGMMSLFEQEPRSATLRAREGGQLWVLDHDAFQQLLDTSHELAKAMLTFLSRRTRRDSDKLAATLRYVAVSGLEEVYEECSPQERIILDSVNRKVAASGSLSGLIDFLFEKTRSISPTNRVSLAFVEEEGLRVVAHYARADYEPLMLKPGYAEDLAGSSLQQAIGSGEPRVINDLEQYLADHPDSRSTRLVVAEGLRSSMTCPLSVEGRRVGLLFRSSKQPHAYDAHQVRLWQALAEQISQAVEKAFRIEQLVAANLAYTEILGFVSHELKSPVASIVMNARILVDGYLGDVPDAQRDKIQHMIDKGDYLLRLVREYLDLARIESGEIRVALQPDLDFVEQVVEPAIDIVEPQQQAKSMALTRQFPDTATQVECDPDLMKVAMVNLVGNAIKYGHDGGEIRVTVERKDQTLRVSVWNEGPGFPEEQRPKLFRKFSRLDTPELKKRKGTGVGLYSTWRIIQLHHGTIRARSELGQWAEFYFSVPLLQTVDA